jgi:D-3-phosphoglycerate dehydrogenase / 2-oxoglutarate reductase
LVAAACRRDETVRALILAPFSDHYLARLGRQLDVVYESWLATHSLQDPEELGARLAGEEVAVLVVEADFVFKEVFDAAPCLRLVGVCRNASNQVEVESATAHGVAVTHAPGRNTNAVAEMTLGLMLALARRIPEATSTVAAGSGGGPALGYERFRGREIAGSTVGVVGFGQIGREVAGKCTALGARVLAHDPYLPEGRVRRLGASPVRLEELVAAADFVTLHVPDAAETQRLFSAGLLGRMKPGAFLVNTSGGSVVDLDALALALHTGGIAGAALDVFPGHQLPAASPLRVAPNVILTPHIGGATAETVERQSRMMTEEIERFIAGKPLRYAVNPDVGRARA